MLQGGVGAKIINDVKFHDIVVLSNQSTGIHHNTTFTLRLLVFEARETNVFGPVRFRLSLFDNEECKNSRSEAFVSTKALTSSCIIVLSMTAFSRHGGAPIAEVTRLENLELTLECWS